MEIGQIVGVFLLDGLDLFDDLARSAVKVPEIGGDLPITVDRTRSAPRSSVIMLTGFRPRHIPNGYVTAVLRERSRRTTQLNNALGDTVRVCLLFGGMLEELGLDRPGMMPFAMK